MQNKNADEMSIKELEDVLRQRVKEHQKILDNEQFQRNEYVVKNIDAFLLVVPEHNRTVCSDENAINGSSRRCLRCILLQAKQENWLSIDVNVRLAYEMTGL